MREVSCRILEMFFREADRQGPPPDGARPGDAVRSRASEGFARAHRVGGVPRLHGERATGVDRSRAGANGGAWITRRRSVTPGSSRAPC